MYSITEAETLRAAIATGALKVRYADGREVTYRSLREMREILGMIESAIAPTPAPCRTSVAGF